MNAQIAQVTPRDRLVEVAEWLEAHTPLKAGVSSFNMASWVSKTECGTSCCIAGAVAQFEQVRNGLKVLGYGDVDAIRDGLSNEYRDIGGYAGDLCGMQPEEAACLFTENMSATPEEAAACIREYLSSGALVWKKKQSAAVTRSRKLPTKNSVLLGVDGKPIEDGAAHVSAILNTKTGLVRAWRPFGNKAFRHQYALDAASSLPTLPGHTPYGLSPLDELKVIGNCKDDYRIRMPDPDEYPDILDDWYWASDLDAQSPSGLAWGADFDSGGVDRDYRDFQGRALAVCRPVSPSQQ